MTPSKKTSREMRADERAHKKARMDGLALTGRTVVRAHKPGHAEKKPA